MKKGKRKRKNAAVIFGVKGWKVGVSESLIKKGVNMYTGLF